MPTLGSLFSGIGLLDLSLTRAGFKVIWHAETDPSASKVLARHWPGVPNLGDVTKVDWSQVERPDVVVGGFPCPPFSSAGKRLGRDDPRYLWPEVARCLRELRPRAALLENVAALLTADTGTIFADILGDLAEAGFDAEWTCVRASDVGAPHRRDRVFIAAHASPHRLERPDAGSTVQPATTRGDEGADGPHGADLARSSGEAAAHAHGGRREVGTERQPGGQGVPGRLPLDPGGRGEAPPHAESDGRARARCARDGRSGPPHEDWGPYAPAISRWERITGERAPDPLDTRGRLNVELVRWMMGAPPDWHGDLSRTAAIRGYGNGVVVQVGEQMGTWFTEGLA